MVEQESALGRALVEDTMGKFELQQQQLKQSVESHQVCQTVIR